MRRNEIRDLFASLMTPVCHEVSIEPKRQNADRPLAKGSKCLQASHEWSMEWQLQKDYFLLFVFSVLSVRLTYGWKNTSLL